jgi:hypothetical protein
MLPDPVGLAALEFCPPLFSHPIPQKESKIFLINRHTLLEIEFSLQAISFIKTYVATTIKKKPSKIITKLNIRNSMSPTLPTSQVDFLRYL